MYKSADMNNPDELIRATHSAVICAIRNVVMSTKEDTKDKKVGGLTWEQIEYLLDNFESRSPKIIYQDKPF